MPLGFRSASSFAADVNSGTATCTKPAGTVATDVLYAIVSRSQTSAGVTSFTSPGWAVAGFFAGSATYAPVAVLTKVAGGSEPANYTFTSNGFSGEDQFVIHMMALTGADNTTPIAVAPAKTDAGSPSTAVVAPSLTIPAGLPDQAWLISVFTAVWFGSASFGPAAGMTERIDVGDVWLHLATDTQAVGAGATGTRTATFSQTPANSPRGISFAAQPAATAVAITDPTPGSIHASAPTGETIDAQPGTVTLTDAAPGSIDVTAPAGESITAIPAVLIPTGIGDVVVEGLAPTIAHQVHLGVGDVEVDGPAVRIQHLVHLGVGEILVEGLPIEVSGRLGIGEIEVSGPPLQVAHGSNGVGGLGGIVAVPRASTTRFIAQTIFTNKILTWELEIAKPTITKELSGAQTISGTIRPEKPAIRKLLESGEFQPHGTWIHQEVENEIAASGILQPYQINGSELAIEAAGVSSYPHRNFFDAEINQIQVDPAQVYRDIWAHLQAQPGGNLGVTVNGSTPVRLGEAAFTRQKVDSNGVPEVDEETGQPVMEDVEAKPYLLAWWEGTNCGSEIDNLTKEAPFDWVERQAWNADRTAVRHWIDIGYPRLGVRQTKLRFATGENVIGNPIPVEEPDELYASAVVVFGKGEGRNVIRGYAGRVIPGRARVVAVIQDATIATVERANAVAADELERRQALIDITDIEVKARHRNAWFGTYEPGDDIFVDVEVDWVGRLQQWERIVSITYSPDSEGVRLQIRRADAFRIGGS